MVSWTVGIDDWKERIKTHAALEHSMAYVYFDRDTILPSSSGMDQGGILRRRLSGGDGGATGPPRMPPGSGWTVTGLTSLGGLDLSHVRWIQSSLNRILGAHLALDGKMGAETRNAIRIFQQRYGLRPDGIMGPQTERALLAAGGAHPPTAVGRPAEASLVKREDQPPSYTFYVNIALGGESPARPMTGIFVPDGYQPRPELDLILYLHGFKASFPDASIDQYWDRRRFPYWPLREGVNESGKNVMLVAPTLGPKSQSGSLTRLGGLEDYLGRVVTALRSFGPYTGRSAPTIRNIILACHSGGGWPMRQLAVPNRPDRFTARIRECWGFDCLYNTGDETVWAQWARSRPDAKLYIYFLDSTERKSRILRGQNVPNVFVEGSSARGHNWVPITHWRNRIQGAPFLLNR